MESYLISTIICFFILFILIVFNIRYLVKKIETLEERHDKLWYAVDLEVPKIHDLVKVQEKVESLYDHFGLTYKKLPARNIVGTKD